MKQITKEQAESASTGYCTIDKNGKRNSYIFGDIETAHKFTDGYEVVEIVS